MDRETSRSSPARVRRRRVPGAPRLATALTSDRSLLANDDPAYGGLRFDAITNLQYSTYRSSVDSGNNLAIALQFDVDYDVTDSTTSFQGRLVFEPYWTFPGGVHQNTWQTWNPLAGKWWGSSASPKVGNATVAQLCPQSSPCTWAQVLADYPNAGTLPAPNAGFLFKAGSSWPGFVGNVDDFTIGVNGNDTTYDLEPVTCTTDCYVSPSGNDTNSGFANDPFATVQHGVNTVSPGGRVHVAAGTYDERVTVNKSISLLGAQAGVDARSRSGSESILAPPVTTPAGQTPLWVSASDVTVDGFTVQGNTYVQLVGAGVYLQPGTHGSQVVNNIVRSNIVGLFLANNNGSDPTLVQHNLFEDNTNPGSASGNDIYADNSTAGGAINGATIDENLFTNATDNPSGVAVDLENTTAPTQFSNIAVSNNSIDNHGRGVIFTGTSSSEVTGNTFTPDATSQVGVYVWDGSPYFSVSNSGISVTNNLLGCVSSCSGDGVDVGDPGATNVAINRNNLQGLTPGVSSTASANVDATCNWWGAATGPGVGGVGGSGPVTTASWLTTSDLSGSCTQPPNVMIALDSPPDGNAGWFKTSPVGGTVTADDTLTGGAAITSISCNVATVPSGLGTPVATATFAVSTQGTTNISCTATNSVGAQSSANTSFMLDSIAPAGSVTIDGGATSTANRSATLGLSATDAIGVTAYRVANGAGCSSAAWIPVSSATSFTGSASLTLPSGTGTKSVCVQYEDAAGNVSTTATATIGLLGVVQMAAGTDHTCARMTDGTARCWGRNNFGQLGDGTTTTRLLPVTVKNSAGTGPLTGVLSIATGSYHSCAVLIDGTTRCWGDNGAGQLGDGTIVNRHLPVVVKNSAGTAALAGVTAVSLAVVFSCARMRSGTAVCWGNNAEGNLGDGTMTNRPYPTAVKNSAGTGPLTGVTEISARGIHVCAVLTNKTAQCWGFNSAGQLGDGTVSVRMLPVVVKNSAGTGALTGVTLVALGDYYTCAVLSSHTAYCWGTNSKGQLGDGTTTNRRLPVAVKGASGSGALAGIVSISSGADHTCASITGGRADCWGNNSGGQVGDGTVTNRTRPVVVKNSTGSGALTGVARDLGSRRRLVRDRDQRLGDLLGRQRVRPAR